MHATLAACCSLLPMLLLLPYTDPARVHRARFFSQYDALFVAQCEAKCWYNAKQSSCQKNCLSKPLNKRGLCPNKTGSPFDTACIEACKKDHECPGIAKCCRHHCGATCQHPEGLLDLVDIPPISRNIKTSESKKRRALIHIGWKPGFDKIAPWRHISPVIYIVEERHHSGRHFMPERLSSWSLCGESHLKNSLNLKNFVKPGRWYQFRVAAVNENGTKGFSNVSQPFTVSMGPRPPKAPHNVTVGPLIWSHNNTLSAELRWANAISDLPIQKYKVFWSQRLHGVTDLDSVLVRNQVVPKNKNKIVLHDLLPDSLYFLQVQAIVHFGKERLKGEKSGLVLNTTNYTNLTDNFPNKVNLKSQVDNLNVEKVYWSQNDLRAHITWEGGKDEKYTVTWWSGPCRNQSGENNHFKLAAMTKDPFFNLYDLQFSCRYRISVREVNEVGLKSFEDTSLTFTTPSCEKMNTDFTRINCTQR